MTAHELARELLRGPDLPVVMNGWGSDEGTTVEVTRLSDPDQEDFSRDGVWVTATAIALNYAERRYQ